LLNWFRCYWRRHHVPARHYLGGFRCAVCGQAGADLSDMGFGFGAGYVAPMRILFTRENSQLTRSSW
jgi:hypothetical protein